MQKIYKNLLYIKNEAKNWKLILKKEKSEWIFTYLIFYMCIHMCQCMSVFKYVCVSVSVKEFGNVALKLTGVITYP